MQKRRVFKGSPCFRDVLLNSEEHLVAVEAVESILKVYQVVIFKLYINDLDNIAI